MATIPSPLQAPVVAEDALGVAADALKTHCRGGRRMRLAGGPAQGHWIGQRRAELRLPGQGPFPHDRVPRVH